MKLKDLLNEGMLGGIHETEAFAFAPNVNESDHHYARTHPEHPDHPDNPQNWPRGIDPRTIDTRTDSEKKFDNMTPEEKAEWDAKRKEQEEWEADLRETSGMNYEDDSQNVMIKALDDLYAVAQEGLSDEQLEYYAQEAVKAGANEDDVYDAIKDARSTAGLHEEDKWAHYNGQTLNEETAKEQVGLIKHTTQHKDHGKGLISERAFDTVGGLVYPQTMGMSYSGPRPSSLKQKIEEVSSGLTRNELYKSLPLLQNALIMELADEYTDSANGRPMTEVVEDLAEAYLSNSVAREGITTVLKSTGLI